MTRWNEAPPVGTLSLSCWKASRLPNSRNAVTCDSVKATGAPPTVPRCVTVPCTDRIARSVIVSGAPGLVGLTGVVIVWSRRTNGVHVPRYRYAVDARVAGDPSVLHRRSANSSTVLALGVVPVQ